MTPSQASPVPPKRKRLSHLHVTEYQIADAFRSLSNDLLEMSHAKGAWIKEEVAAGSLWNYILSLLCRWQEEVWRLIARVFVVHERFQCRNPGGFPPADKLKAPVSPRWLEGDSTMTPAIWWNGAGLLCFFKGQAQGYATGRGPRRNGSRVGQEEVRRGTRNKEWKIGWREKCHGGESAWWVFRGVALGCDRNSQI